MAQEILSPKKRPYLKHIKYTFYISSHESPNKTFMVTYGLHMMAFHMQVAPPLLPGSDGPALSYRRLTGLYS